MYYPTVLASSIVELSVRIWLNANIRCARLCNRHYSTWVKQAHRALSMFSAWVALARLPG